MSGLIDYMKTVASVSEELDDLGLDYEKQVEKLATRVRRTLVMPFCKRHKLQFVSGMGVWCFWGKDRRTQYYADLEDLAELHDEQAATIFNVLSTRTVSDAHTLGDFMRDYTPPGF